MSYNIPVRVRHLIERVGHPDPYAIARELKCEIIVCDLPRHINGMWQRVLRRKYIFVNERLADWQQETVIAHELGHIILHKGYHASIIRQQSYSNSNNEREADEFAVLLMQEHCGDAPYDFAAFLKYGTELLV